MIACAAAQDDVSSDDVDDKLLDRSNAASGWGIFLCFVALLTEAVIILLRFLNCAFIQSFPKLSLIVVSCQARTLKLEQGGSYLSLAGPKAREAGLLGGSGGMPPGLLRPSEIVSGAIWRYNSNSWTRNTSPVPLVVIIHCIYTYIYYNFCLLEQDICVSGVFVVLLFITGIPLAVYANEWDDEVEAADDSLQDTLRRIPPALRAAYNM